MSDPIQEDMFFAEKWTTEKYKEFIDWVNSEQYDTVVEAYYHLARLYEENQTLCNDCDMFKGHDNADICCDCDNIYKVATAECPDVDYFDTLEEAKEFCDRHSLDYGYIMLCDSEKREIGCWGDFEE